MSDHKKDLLPCILVFRGPGKDSTLRLMATDLGDGMQITHWAKTDIIHPDIGGVVRIYEPYVEMATLNHLTDNILRICRSLQDGLPAIWVTKSGLRNAGTAVFLEPLES